MPISAMRSKAQAALRARQARLSGTVARRTRATGREALQNRSNVIS